MSEDRKLTGKVAMVFGGSRGIGAAAARRLAREGANVGLTYVSAPDKAADTVRAIEEEGRTGFAIKADSADPTAIRDAVTQAAAVHLSEGGRVITIGSNTAVRSSYPGSSVYAMTKAAVAVMVKGIAVDLAPRGITVNNIQPGPTLTDMTASYIDSITSAIPLKRVGDPDEIAGLVAYLASGESGYMTGSSLTIDGGMAL